MPDRAKRMEGLMTSVLNSGWEKEDRQRGHNPRHNDCLRLMNLQCISRHQLGGTIEETHDRE